MRGESESLQYTFLCQLRIKLGKSQNFWSYFTFLYFLAFTFYKNVALKLREHIVKTILHTMTKKRYNKRNYGASANLKFNYSIKLLLLLHKKVKFQLKLHFARTTSCMQKLLSNYYETSFLLYLIKTPTETQLSRSNTYAAIYTMLKFFT